MPRIEEKKKPQFKQEVVLYTARDFFALEAELEEYKIDIPHYPGNNGTPYFGLTGMQKYFTDKGALCNRKHWTILNPELYKKEREKLIEYYNWARRKEYAIKMQGREFEELAEQINVDDIPF